VIGGQGVGRLISSVLLLGWTLAAEVSLHGESIGFLQSLMFCLQVYYLLRMGLKQNDKNEGGILVCGLQMQMGWKACL